MSQILPYLSVVSVQLFSRACPIRVTIAFDDELWANVRLVQVPFKFKLMTSKT